MPDELTPVPPRLDDAPAPVEPLRPVRLDGGVGSPAGSPVHPVAALLLLLVDNLWNLADWAVLGWVITIPLSFLMVFVPSLILQRLLRRDGWGRALGLALVLGVIAAVPTSVTGTPVGLALLAWTGLDRLLGRSARR